ncbi:MAG: hypothetical protein JXA96_01770 [Sedimentisphaerales bacterium]|nr:hypothetical protein [Sedimentisphaerales bacterium]
MSSVSTEEKQLIFEYCVGITSPEQAAKAIQLIADNQEASELYSKLKTAFKPLETIGMQNCPDYIVEKTLLRIPKASNPNKELNQLLKAEQDKRKPVKIGFLRNFSEVAAIAAALIIFTGILVPTFGYARQKYWQQQCSMGMSDIYQGLRKYMSDNDNTPPSVARAEGAPWWKIGKKDESNTADKYILIAQGYVEPGFFVCKGAKRRNTFGITKEEFQAYEKQCQDLKDFPDRRYVSYSFPIGCQKQSRGKMSCRKVLMSDRNPIFETLPADYSVTITIELKKELLHANSSNHNNRGQNILFGDGRVEFTKTRQIGSIHDDLFTLQDTDVYQGNEIPSCTTDIFLAP